MIPGGGKSLPMLFGGGQVARAKTLDMLPTKEYVCHVGIPKPVEALDSKQQAVLTETQAPQPRQGNAAALEKSQLAPNCKSATWEESQSALGDNKPAALPAQDHMPAALTKSQPAPENTPAALPAQGHIPAALEAQDHMQAALTGSQPAPENKPAALPAQDHMPAALMESPSPGTEDTHQPDKPNSKKRNTPSQRVAECLKKAKAARLMKETECSKELPAGKDEGPTPEQPQPTVEHAQQDKTTATPGLPELPKDWESTAYVTPEQQEVPKKRGRKPKAQPPTHDKQKPEPKPKQRARKAKTSPEDMPAPVEGSKTAPLIEATAASTAEPDCSDTVKEAPARKGTRATKAAKAAKGPTANCKAKAKAKTKANKKQHETPTMPTASSAMEMLPVPKTRRRKAKELSAEAAPPPTAYVAQEVDEECNSFDAYAAAAAQCHVAELTSNTKEKPEKDAEQKNIEYKKRLSRKSCAYKKARTLALKAGKSKEEATAAAKKVSSLVIGKLYIYVVSVPY